MLALIPLLARMGFIHVVLLYGTNNVQTVGHQYTETQLHHKSLGARFVLVARISYAAFIWTSKLTVSEFLKRITIRIWRKSYEITLQGLRIFLFVTFCAVVIATLTECQPFDHYWQVVPDPGPQCRQGFSNLITMGTCDIITDIMLVAFPIPIVMRSGQTWRRKLQLISLFSLSIIMIAVTATRVPSVISHHGRQQYRTVWASCEILASTAVSNAVILGSFLRDKGTKKNKYQSHSISDSIDRSSIRRPTAAALRQVGSDEDLFRSLGCRVPEHLRDEADTLPRPAPAALPARAMAQRNNRRMPELAEFRAEPPAYRRSSEDSDKSPRKSVAVLQPLPSPTPSTKPSVSFFDVGGLLEGGSKPSLDSHSQSRSRSTTMVDSGAIGTIAQDFAPPSPVQSRRDSHAFVTDIGGIATPVSGRHGVGNGYARRHSDAQQTAPGGRHRSAPIGVLGPMLERHETQQSLQDAGGLLGEISRYGYAQSGKSPPTTSEGVGRPDLDEHGIEQGMQGVGGPLAVQHLADPSATALRRVHEHPQRPSAPSIEPPHSEQRGPDDMNLHDPGGLLR